ncbi:hypothetical protein CDAR_291441 [Caerostris darwini]|uniref:Uncharacterized protein n=1 Tax=Caerostris darwini TaxID=1538125 RepID=A0AAV4RNT2_9ARAC|nr:hypothetical protein CDAR_291441 [Caerostris darwini]
MGNWSKFLATKNNGPLSHKLISLVAAGTRIYRTLLVFLIVKLLMKSDREQYFRTSSSLKFIGGQFCDPYLLKGFLNNVCVKYMQEERTHLEQQAPSGEEEVARMQHGVGEDSWDPAVT